MILWLMRVGGAGGGVRLGGDDGERIGVCEGVMDGLMGLMHEGMD